MSLVNAKVYTQEELIRKLRLTPVMGDGTLVYDKSTIIIAKQNKDDIEQKIHPCQRYALLPIINNLKDVIDKVKHMVDINLMDVQGYVHLTWVIDGELVEYDWLPPVVEWDYTHEKYIVVDGIHRLLCAMYHGYNPYVVMMLNPNKDYPYYAHPNANGWDDVIVMTHPPENKDKWKDYRKPMSNYKEDFRDFNKEFPGITRKRGV